MRSRITAMLVCTALIGAACADTGQTDTAPEGELRAGEALVTRTNLIVERAPDHAQLVFVGHSRSVVPAGYEDEVFLPFAAFAVERDGIPNEFPAPDTIVMLLEDAGVRSGSIVIVGEPIPAGRAFAAFDYIGMADQVALHDGGVAAFDHAATEQPADRAGAADDAPEATDAAPLVMNVREDMIVDAEWVYARLNDPAVAILDARPPAEYSGETPGDGVTRPGHIAGARNLFWQDLVESQEMPTLKSDDELRQLFRDAGVDDGDTVVAYCRTGGQASFLYAVARYLGYDVKLYDGSYVDWSATDHPVQDGPDAAQ